MILEVIELIVSNKEKIILNCGDNLKKKNISEKKAQIAVDSSRRTVDKLVNESIINWFAIV